MSERMCAVGRHRYGQSIQDTYVRSILFFGFFLLLFSLSDVDVSSLTWATSQASDLYNILYCCLITHRGAMRQAVSFASINFPSSKTLFWHKCWRQTLSSLKILRVFFSAKEVLIFLENVGIFSLCSNAGEGVRSEKTQKIHQKSKAVVSE